MRKFLLFISLLLCVPAFALEVPLTMVVSPHGAGLTDTGSSTITITAACTYAIHGPDNCATAGTITWASHDTSAATVTTPGGVVTWIKTVNSTNYPLGTFMATAAISATVAGACNGSATVCTDYMTVQGQHNGDNWQVLVTPAVNMYNSPVTGIAPALTVPQNATVTIGAGYDLNGGGSGNPTPTCNWSSNNGNFTVNRYGFATAAATSGTSVITCGQSGNASLTGGTLSITLTATNPTPSPTTWYVRSDGGTPYNATDNPTGTCDGKGDAAVSGSTPNQHCAYGDFEYLYFDQVTHFKQQWVIAGGDTVIVRKPTGGAVYHTAIINQGSFIPTNCADVLTNGCDVPWPPAGTVANPTRILGENFGDCSLGNGPDPSKTTPLTLWGREALNIKLTQNVVIGCIELATSGVFGNYGIWQSALTSNATIQNVWIHGLAQGIFGATGSGVTYDHLWIRATTNYGINMDDAPYAQSNISVAGGATMTNSLTEFVGCQENYPPGSYPYIGIGGCKSHDAGNSGSPDGFSTASTTGSWTFNNDIWRYNFEDGLDGLHMNAQNLTVTNSQAYGNLGQQFKMGPADNVTFRQNSAVGNCNRLLQPFGGVTIANGSVTGCRAGGGMIVVEFAGGVYNVQSNSIAAVGNPAFLLSCQYGWGTTCPLGVQSSAFQDNAFIAYTGTNYSGGGTPESQDNPNSFITANHNQYFGTTNNGTAGTGDITTNTLFNNQPNPATVLTPSTEAAALDNYDFTLTSSSNGKYAGVAYTGMAANDQSGQSWHAPPSIGALEFFATTPTVATPTFSPVAGTYTSTQSVTISTVTGGASIIYTTDGTTPTVTALTCTITHGTLYSGTVSVATTETLKAIGCLASSNASAVATAAYTITGAVVAPTFSPVAGTYNGTQSVTISTVTGGASIVYTSDGSTPTVTANTCTITHGTLYSGAISVSTSITLKAIGCKSTFAASTTSTAAYVINTVNTINVNGNIKMSTNTVSR